MQSTGKAILFTGATGLLAMASVARPSATSTEAGLGDANCGSHTRTIDVRPANTDPIDLNSGLPGSPRGISQGDANDDCRFDGRDIQAFVSIAVSDTAPTSEDLCRADFTSNGTVAVDDIGGFVSQLLTQTGPYTGTNCVGGSCP